MTRIICLSFVFFFATCTMLLAQNLERNDKGSSILLENEQETHTENQSDDQKSAETTISEETSETEPTVGLRAFPPRQKETAYRSNIVKLGIPSLFFLNPHLSYERVLTDRLSVNAQFAFFRFGNGLLTNLIPDDAQDFSGKFRLTGLTITPELRIYGRKNGAPKGFYFAPYFRYANYGIVTSGDAELTNEDGTVETYTVDVEGRWKTTGVGIQLGTQWLLGDAVTIDWSFLGLGINRYNLTGEVSSIGLDVDYQKLKEDIEREIQESIAAGDIPSRFGENIEVTAGDNFVKVKAPAGGIGFRTSIKLGFRF